MPSKPREVTAGTPPLRVLVIPELPHAFGADYNNPEQRPEEARREDDVC